MKWKMDKNALRLGWFTLIATLFIGLFIAIDFSSYPISGIKDVGYVAFQWLIVFIATLGIVGLISINRYVFAIIYPLLILGCSVLGYFAFTMNSTLTVMVLDAALHNDWATSSDLIGTPLVFCSLVSQAIAALFVWFRFKQTGKSKYACFYFFVFATIVLGATFNYTVKRLLANHIPYNVYYVSMNYLSEQKIALEYRDSLSAGSSCDADSLIVVFVLGESLRADHLGINGYARNTTPELGTLPNLISLPNITTQHAYTNASVPYILTRADSLNEQIAYTERSFIDIFKSCGFETSWLANQESAHSYVYFMHECDTLVFATLNKSSYTFDKWLDESLLPLYDMQLNTAVNRKLILLHTIGSHWWYNSHFSDAFSTYQPIIKSKILSSNSAQEMINSYDNTILYTDHFLTTLIHRLKEKNAMLVYLSDHGESLGEEGVWLHAIPTPDVSRPASFVWLSDTYIFNYPDKSKSLINNSNKEYNANFLFHTLLDGACIATPLIDKKLSVFN